MNCVTCGIQLPWSMGRPTCSACAPYTKEDLKVAPHKVVYPVVPSEEDFGAKYPGLAIELDKRAAVPQPPPLPGERRVLDFVVDDLHARAVEGKKKYGTYLYSGNGRDALMDAYQEALDLVMYLKQAIMERG